MRYSIFTFCLLFVIVFSSCEKESVKGDLKGKKEKEKKEECLYLIYPVTWTMPDDSNITPEDEKEFWIEIKSWYEANPGVEEKPELQYPVDVKLKDGEILTVEDEAAMIQIKEEHCNLKDGE